MMRTTIGLQCLSCALFRQNYLAPSRVEFLSRPRKPSCAIFSSAAASHEEFIHRKKIITTSVSEFVVLNFSCRVVTQVNAHNYNLLHLMKVFIIVRGQLEP